MKRELKQVLLLFLVFVLIKIIISYFIPASRASSDDYRYLKMAESFFYNLNFNVHGLPNIQYSPLYPITISVANLFQDYYLAIKIINSILSSLIIFPSYLLAKEFLSEKKSLFITIFIVLLPSNFNLSSYIMSENLFYSLFLFSIYFIYKSFKDNKIKDYLLAGIFIVASSLTKIHGLILIGLVGFLILFKLTRRLNKVYKAILFLLIMIIGLMLSKFLLCDLINNAIYCKEISNLFLGNIVYPFFIWSISYLGFIILASGFIFVPLALLSLKIKNNKLNLFREISLITSILTLIVAANHHLRNKNYIYNLNDFIFVAGRPVGRYVDFLLPLIIILGFVMLNYYLINKNKTNKILGNGIILSSFVMLISAHLITRSLTPFNNISLTIFGAIKYITNLIFYSNPYLNNFTLASFIIIGIIFILTPLISYFILKKLNYRKIVSLLLIFMILNSSISLGAVYYAAKTSWYYDSEQRQLALYLNSLDEKRSKILIDERDHGDLSGDNYNLKALYSGTNQSKYTIIGYWLNDELIIGNINNTNADYIISTYKLDLDKVYETKNKIYLYKFH